MRIGIYRAIGKGREITALLLISCLFPFLYPAAGCSGKLTRGEVKHQIDSKLKKLPPDSSEFMTSLEVPGFRLHESDHSSEYFTLGRQATHDGLSLENALAKLGYITIEDGGSGDIPVFSTKQHFDSTRIVTLTAKVGEAVTKTGDRKFFQTGFECQTEPYPPQCDLLLVAMGKDYEITGITQDALHAIVKIRIPWKLTPLALELKPLAERDAGVPLSPYDTWQKFLNSRPAAGGSEATIFFQKFDDGWRIVGENGNS